VNTLQVRIRQRGKQILFNDKPVSDRKELIQNIPCIVFSHGDIAFVSGSPDMQRHFFNQTLSLQHPYFIDLLRRYRKILRQRNALLKERRMDLLEVYDEQWVQVGCDIQQLRAQTVEAFNATFSEIHREVSGISEELSIQYRPSWREWSDKNHAYGMVRERRPHDVGYGTSTSGPHRDRFVFRLGNRDFTNTASTGQLRLVSLVLRVAQAVYFAEGTGKRPVLLIDDVLLELDAEKRQRFLAALPDYEQAFFTFLPDEPYQRYLRDSTRVYIVEDGGFTEHGTSR
jgi:DNA replication and repair protein RecF